MGVASFGVEVAAPIDPPLEAVGGRDLARLEDSMVGAAMVSPIARALPAHRRSVRRMRRTPRGPPVQRMRCTLEVLQTDTFD